MLYFFGIALFFIIGAFFLKAYRKGVFIWLPAYVTAMLRKKEAAIVSEPVHIMFCLVDHFEPGNGKADISLARDRVSTWIKEYPMLAYKHCDSDGIVPQHTWFFPPHYNQSDHLLRMTKMCQYNFGEIEMHLHHNHNQPFPEENGSLTQKLKNCLDSYSELGIWGKIDGRNSYAFIHGNWSLDNSGGETLCGENNELEILKSTGCYADFTFPAPDRCQPRMVNTIYYAKGNPSKPKSYNKGIPVKFRGNAEGDLMIIQGPKGIRWKGKPFLSRPCIESSEIDFTNLPTKRRVDYWIRNGVRVSGQPNWVFVKLHCHGAVEKSFNSLVGKHADQMYTHLENKYNDGKNYQLHYVTAREMYNIIKSAESGMEGNPNLYRDFIVTRPSYKRTMKKISEKSLSWS
jgi:hypothetical protein